MYVLKIRQKFNNSMNMNIKMSIFKMQIQNILACTESTKLHK
jgi:hypothetical protein